MNSKTQSLESISTKTQVTPDGFLGPTTVLLIVAEPAASAALKLTSDLIPILKKIGIRIFVAGATSPPFAFEFKKHSDKFIVIPEGKFSLSAFIHLRRQIRKYHINIVHSLGRTAGVYSRLLGLMTKASIIHSPALVPYHPSTRDQLRLKIDRLLAKFKSETVFLSASEQSKALQIGILRRDRESIVIESSIDMTEFPPRSQSAIAFSTPGSQSQIRIGARLRIENPSGLTAFLKIVKEAASHGQFTCIGMTREQISIYGKIPPNLEVVGPVSDVKKWLYSLDVFVSTTSVEGQIIGTNEAIAAGAVCLLSRIPPHEVFFNQHSALLFDAKQPQSFIETLESLKSDRALREMLLANSRFMLERSNDSESFRNSFIDLYRSAVKRAAGLIL